MNKKENMQEHTSEITSNGKADNDMQQSTDFQKTNKTYSSLEEELLNHVANSKATFKNQQKEDPDLTFEEKLTIARDFFNKSHCLFLSKFGHYLKEEHLKYFEKHENEDYEVSYHIKRLHRYFNNSTRQVDVKNRRYQALKTLIEKGEYFSECEMMKRNPLLYEQLIGQYMTEKQKRVRDNIDTKNITFVNLLMESIERDTIKKKQRLQEEEEQNVLEESDSDDESNKSSVSQQTNHQNDSLWGQIDSSEKIEEQQNVSKENRKPSQNISNAEKQILREEFTSYMYQNFLDGKDVDFDYSTVDENEIYDNIDLQSQDQEDKYFDSESPEVVAPEENSNDIESEDELDIYMKSLKVK